MAYTRFSNRSSGTRLFQIARGLSFMFASILFASWGSSLAGDTYHLAVTTKGKGSWGTANITEHGYVRIDANLVEIAVTNRLVRVDSQDERAVMNIPLHTVRFQIDDDGNKIVLSAEFHDGEHYDKKTLGSVYLFAYSVFQNMIYPFIFSDSISLARAEASDTDKQLFFKQTEPAHIDLKGLGSFRTSEWSGGSYKSPANITMLPILRNGEKLGILIGNTLLDGGVWRTHVREMRKGQRLPRKCLVMSVSPMPDTILSLTTIFDVDSIPANIRSYNSREYVLLSER